MTDTQVVYRAVRELAAHLSEVQPPITRRRGDWACRESCRRKLQERVRQIAIEAGLPLPPRRVRVIRSV